MKKFNPRTTWAKTALFLFLFFCTTRSFSQGMVFQNPSLYAGVAGKDGAVYRFAGVKTNVDALLTINKRSSSQVTLDSVDMTSTGYGKAFQPMVTYTNSKLNGTVSWWMEFNISFVNSSTLAPLVVDSLAATALDIDGDDHTLSEQFTALGSGSYVVNNPTSLTAASATDTIGAAGSAGTITTGVRFTASTTNLNGIDTSTKNAMVTIKYKSVSGITFRYGGQMTGTGGAVTASRMNSLWFQSFTYNAPVLNSLPVYLASFTAELKGTTAVTLNWATTWQKNASHFVIQRATDAKSFDDAGVVFTDGSTGIEQHYTFNDNLNFSNDGLIYYRLKIVDMDGKYGYSEVVVVRTNPQTEQSDILAFPNPAYSQVHITIPSGWENKEIAYSFYNMHGSLVKQHVSSSAGQTETFNIAGLPSGLYIVKVANGNQVATKKILKVL